MRQHYLVQYAGLTINLEANDDLAEMVEREIEPFFSVRVAPKKATSIANLALLCTPLPSELAECQNTEPRVVPVDTSLYKHLASDGRRWDLKDGHLVKIDLTGTYGHFEPGRGSIALYQPETLLMVRDAIRLLKGLITVSVEHQGGVQLHSSSVVADGRGVLLLGDMWQGKTTLLLDMLSEFHVQQLSCDTTVLMSEAGGGRIAAYGWPSPFSVSHGTLADHPELYEFFPHERKDVNYATLWDEGKKAVLTSDQVVSRFSTSLVSTAKDISLCLIVRFKPEERTMISRVDSVDEFAAHLQDVYLGSRDPIYHNWHQYLNIDAETINKNISSIAKTLHASSEVYVLTWAPSATSMMKRIPFLAKHHKGLSQLARTSS